MADKPKPTIDEQIAEVGREIGMRKAIYPQFVIRQRITQAESDQRLGAMEAAYATLKFVKDNAAAIRAAAKEAKAAKPADSTAAEDGPK